MFTDNPSIDFNFASVVAEFGLILSESEHKGNALVESVLERARIGKGEDLYGIKNEFTELAEMYKKIA